ncbi:MAG: hypothetical protein AAGD38_21150, partial [Acidobacteriota bacterium]
MLQLAHRSDATDAEIDGESSSALRPRMPDDLAAELRAWRGHLQGIAVAGHTWTERTRRLAIDLGVSRVAPVGQLQ